MKLLRFGASLVFARASDVEKAEKFLTNLFGVSKISVDDALKNSGEFETIIFVTPLEEWKTILNLRRGAFLVRMRCDSVLKELLNSKAPIDRINLGPHMILLRIPQGVEKVTEIISERYNGKVVSLARGINEGEERDTLLIITDKKLTLPVGVRDLKSIVLVHEDFVDFYRTLSVDLPILLYKALPEGWKEIVIRIYDTEKRYEENIERLLLVLEDLDLGFVISEGWDWDYPRPFMRIRVYKVKLITWEDPLRIKFLLKGLEYKGYNRFADIDVFVEGEKIPWIKVSKKFNSKFELAKAAREELEKLLSEGAKRKLHKIEAKLLGEEKDLR
jgi:hypothetical protein